MHWFFEVIQKSTLNHSKTPAFILLIQTVLERRKSEQDHRICYHDQISLNLVTNQ